MESSQKEKSQKKFVSRFWQTIEKHTLAKIGLLILVLILFISLIGPNLTPYTIDEINLRASYQSPSQEHWLGTDRLGRDVFTRVSYAGRISLLVGVSGTFLSIFVGVFFGAIAGFFGGKIDSVLLKMQEIQMCFPPIILVIALMSFVRGGIFELIIFLGLFNWVGAFRLARGEFVSIREEEYVESARIIGASNLSIMFKHILPNALPPLVVSATLQVALLILAEAGLSFLGLGVRPPIPSWGNMLSSARQLEVLRTRYWLWIPPGALISLTVIAINFLGDGLRDAVDPYSGI